MMDARNRRLLRVVVGNHERIPIWFSEVARGSCFELTFHTIGKYIIKRQVEQAEEKEGAAYVAKAYQVIKIEIYRT